MTMTVAGSPAGDGVGEKSLRTGRIAAIAGSTVLGFVAVLLAVVATGLMPNHLQQIAIGFAAVISFALTIVGGVFGARLVKKAKNERVILDALDALNAAYAATGSAGDLLYGNSTWDRLFPSGGRPLENLRDYVIGDEQHRDFETFARDVRAGRSAHITLRVRIPNLDWQRVEISGTPLAQSNGIFWRIEDVTARARQQEAIEASWSIVQQVFDEVPIGLFSINGTGKFLAANATIAGWLGTTPEALLREGARLQDFLLPAAQAAQTRHVFDPYAPAEGIEIILQGRQGRLIKLSISQSVHRDGTALETRSIVRDLASERTWDDAVRFVRQRFQRFFEVAPVGIALVEGDGRFAEANQALAQLLTDGREELAGRSLYEFVNDETQAELRRRLSAALNGEARVESLDLRLKGNREKTVEVYVNRLEKDDGGVAGGILHFIDLTEQKNLEVQFAQSQKMQAVGQLAGGVAHDFNNLLTAMIGFCDLLLLRFRPGDQSFADIMQIKQNANRAANLVRQLLAFSRQQTLQPRILNIGDVLSELSHLLNRLLGDNIELKMLHGRNLGSVKVDQGQLEQVIINLAVNARDAMPDGGTLTLRTSSVESQEPIRHQMEVLPAGAYVLIDVTDDGLGIPREILNRIFEPFFSTKEMGAGTGLGLSTVYGIVKQTGGFVFVDSTVGVGTKFTIYLPQHQPQASAEEEKAPLLETLDARSPRDLTGAGTILLVEDEDPVRLFSARALRNKGYNVLEARSGEAALKLIAETTEHIDLILTDVVMPRMDGPTMIKQVREQLKDVKVIFISGYAEDTFRKRLDDDRDIHFLPKPFSLKQLAAKVKDCLSAPGP